MLFVPFANAGRGNPAHFFLGTFHGLDGPCYHPWKKGKLIHILANAVFSRPKLGALATNGRSAHFLDQAIVPNNLLYSRVPGSVQLDEWTQEVVAQVVDDFIHVNGLCPAKRRRVAASLIHEINQGDSTRPPRHALDEN